MEINKDIKYFSLTNAIFVFRNNGNTGLLTQGAGHRAGHGHSNVKHRRNSLR